ncbi:MAG TPA: penicillin-binding protein 2, partial [Nitrospinaceae bacterium]|nr:penicillin-binding protein 2 [Nitrospinaceae bacterium]
MSFFRYSAESSENVRKKIKIYVILVVVSFVCLWMRVWYLQILKGEDFMGRSEENRIRKVSLPAYRGTIKDRNGETLVNVRPSFNLYVTPEDAKDLPNSLAFLSAKFEIDGDKLKEDISQSRPFKNVLIKRDISRQEVAYVEENKMRLPGIHIKVEPLRSYVYKDLAAHILGYLGEVSKEKLKNSAYSKYALGDMIGRDGLEDIYEFNLKGEKGFKEVEVDVSGRELKTLRKLPPESGDSLV